MYIYKILYYYKSIKVAYLYYIFLIYLVLLIIFLLFKDNVQLYLQLIDLAYSSSHSRDSEIISAFDTAVESKDLSLEERYQFSLRKMEFLEEMSGDISR